MADTDAAGDAGSDNGASEPVVVTDTTDSAAVGAAQAESKTEDVSATASTAAEDASRSASKLTASSREFSPSFAAVGAQPLPASAAAAPEFRLPSSAEAASGDGAASGGVAAAASAATTHPLEHSWTFWHGKPKNVNGSWNANQIELATVRTIEEFWSLFNKLREPCELQTGGQYLMFREGVTPDWSAPELSNGGRWLAEFPTSTKGGDGPTVKRTGPDGSTHDANVSQLWQNLLLGVIGETLEDGTEIRGAVIEKKRDKGKRRMMYRLFVWTDSANNESLQRSIGRRIRQALRVKPGTVKFGSFKERKSKRACV